MDHLYYASPFAAIAWPLIFGPLAAVWIVGRGNLLGRRVHGRWSGTALFWIGIAVLGTLTGASLATVISALVAPRPAIAISSDGVTCRFGGELLALPWNYVTTLRQRTDNATRKGAIIHEHYAVFGLDPRYIDHLPWDLATRRTRTASCYLDDLDAAAGDIFVAINTSWRAARR